MSETLNPALFAIPILGAISVLAYFGWRRKQRAAEIARLEQERLERIRSAKIPEGATYMADEATPPQAADRSGRLLLILDGTFGANVGGLALLWMLFRCGLEGIIGSILLIELDARRRQRFLERVPAVFQDRIVVASSPALSGGLGNRHPLEVQASIHRWGAPVIQAARQVCDIHQRRQQGHEAALALVFVSMGGQAILATKAVEVIRQEFSQVQCYGFAALPVDDRLLSRVEGVLEAYRQVGVKGFVLSSNRENEVQNDYGMVAAITGFAAAADHADAGNEQNNNWTLLFDETPGGIVSYHTYLKPVPGYRFQPDPSVAPRYFVYQDSIVSAVHTVLEEVQDSRYNALGVALTGAVAQTSRFDIVLAPLYPDALKDVEDEVVQGRGLLGETKRNHHLLFAPVVVPVSPERPVCPVSAVSLAAVADPQGVLRQLTGTQVDVTSPVADGNGAGGEDVAETLVAAPRRAVRKERKNHVAVA